MENPKDIDQKNISHQPDQKQQDGKHIDQKHDLKQHDQKQHDQKHDQKNPENKPNTDSQKKPAQGMDDIKQTPRPTAVPSKHEDEHREPEKKRA